jgi:acetylornithine deacetylase/succinyl-diaminopimelate desuccinylase-like protein
VSRGFYLTLAVVLVAAGALFLWLRRIDRPTPEDAIYVPRKEVITPEIELLREYIRIDTSNPPGLEAAGARFLVEQLSQAGIQAEYVESAPGRANVYARIRGRRPGEGLMLLNHIDVVPADPAGWEFEPFAAEIRHNMLHGRGTLDMKGIAIAQLLAFTDLARSGRVPERDVVFLATADEEAGSSFGMEWLLEHRPDMFEGIRYSLTEGGITETIREQVTYFAVEIGSKPFTQLEARAKDRESLRRARIAIGPLMERREPDRITPAVREYFRAIAPQRKQGGEILADVEKAVAEGKFWNLENTYRLLTQNTVVMSGPEERDGEWVADVYLSNLPDEEPERAIGGMRARLEPFGVEVRVIRSMAASGVSPFDTPMFALIEKQVKAEYGKDVAVGPFFPPDIVTDSRYLRPRGVVAYGFWPFPVDFFQSTGIHGAGERVRLDWFVRGVNVMRRLTAEYAG